jgi:general secretion pathway protein M
MLLQPGTPVSRLAAIGLLVLALLAGWTFVVAPLLRGYQTTAEQIERSQSLLERYRRLAAQQPELQRMVDQASQAAGASAGYLKGETEALAAASLQEQVRALVDDAGGELRSTQILPLEPAEEGVPARRVGLRLQLAIDLEGLQALLHGLETAEPYLFLEDVTMRERRMRRRRRNDPEPPPMLDVALEIYGFVRGLEN